MPGPGEGEAGGGDRKRGPAESAELPFDSDTDVADQRIGPPRPARVHPADAALVVVGGGTGVAARYLITAATTPRLTEPLITMVINVVGCLLLGLLLESLALRGTDGGHRRTARLLVGTGMLGGFTTYSTFTVEIQQMLRSGEVLAGVGYGVGSVLLGVAAAAAGVSLSARVHGRRTSR